MGIQSLLTITAGAIEVLAPLPYIVDTLRGRTRPNVVTWFTWSIINAINTAAAFTSGSWQTGVYSLCGLVATGTIVGLGLRNGLKHYTRFDAACQVAALLGIPLWLLTSRPEAAVLVILAVDFAGGLPTLRHAWRAPHEETLQTFAYSALAASLLLLGLEHITLIAVAMPLYILLFDSAVAGTILWRSRRPAPPIAQ